jgi:hypothetical protein
LIIKNGAKAPFFVVFIIMIKLVDLLEEVNSQEDIDLSGIDDAILNAIKQVPQNEVTVGDIALLAPAIPGIINNLARVVKTLMMKSGLKLSKSENPLQQKVNWVINLSSKLDSKLDSPIRLILKPFIKDDGQRNKTANILKAVVLVIAGILYNLDLSKIPEVVTIIKSYIPNAWSDILSIRKLPDLAVKLKTLFV